MQPITISVPLNGMTQAGNIQLAGRPLVKTPNGVGTIRSTSVNIDGREVLIPTIYDNSLHTVDEAIARYMATGKHLGIFDTPAHATNAGEYLSNLQGRNYGLGALPKGQ
jgi:hypothetical protein